MVIGSEINGSYIALINDEGKVESQYQKDIRATNNLIIKTEDEGIIIASGDGSSYIVTEYKKTEESKDIIESKTLIEPNDSNLYKGDYENVIKSMVDTTDGGYIAGGYFEGIKDKEYVIKLSENQTIETKGNGDGLIIKYDDNNEIEWFTQIGGSDNDYINQIIQTKDGGFLAQGTFSSPEIQLDEDHKLINTSRNNYDIMIIKYKKSETGKGYEVEWAKQIGGRGNDYTNSISITKDEGFIVGGYFQSSEIKLDESHIIRLPENSSEFTCNGMIIKYKKLDVSNEYEVEWATSIGESGHTEITSVEELPDGSIIASGYFENSQITIDENNILTNHSAYNDGMIIKYKKSEKQQEYEVEYAKVIGGEVDDSVSYITKTEDGGYIISAHIGSEIVKIDEKNVAINRDEKNKAYGGLIIKYNQYDEIEWYTCAGEIKSILQTSDGGYIAVEGDNVICKYDTRGEVEYKTEIGEWCLVIESLLMKNDIEYIIGGYIQNSVYRASVLYKVGGNAIIAKTKIQNAIPAVENLKIKNEIKTFKITTEVEETDGEKRGQITGEGANPYERVKYNNTNQLPITMTPDDNYEIEKVTINGEAQNIEELEADGETGSYTLPKINNITENKHIVVKYINSDKKFVIEKTDEKGEPLAGAKFRIEQIDDREKPENVIGAMQESKQEYYYPDETQDITESTKKAIQNNGPIYVTADTSKEIKGKLGEKQDGNTGYKFEYNEDSKTYKPTNADTYFTSYNDAHSYFEINLKDYEGKDLAVVIEAESKNAYVGYATITNNTQMPSRQYNEASGQFMTINGTSSDSYTSQFLKAGNIYYLHLVYKSNVYSSNQSITINSIKIYEADGASYYFEGKEGNEIYTSNNVGERGKTASSYMPIDLSDIGEDETVAVVVNAQISSDGSCSDNYNYSNNETTYSASGDYGIIEMKDQGTSYGNIKIGGKVEEKDYIIEVKGGKQYNLNFTYNKQKSKYGYVNEDEITDTFTINSVKVYKTKIEKYSFKEETIENGGITTKRYVSQNKGKPNTQSSSYMKIDLRDHPGKYNIIVDAEISSQSDKDYGFITITNTEDIPRDKYTGTSVIREISEEKENKRYTQVISGEQEYYLHFIYRKDKSINEGNDEFIINSVEIAVNKDDLYKIEATTDEQGKIIANLPTTPTNMYSITEIEAPEGYQLLKDTTVQMMEGEENVETIENQLKKKLIVHHYLKDETIPEESPVQVAEDEIYYGEEGEQYKTAPKANLTKYELVKDENGEEEIPINWQGEYGQDGKDVEEVTYYYTYKPIPLIEHHYIEGTKTNVPLEGGESATDKITYGKEGQSYQTEALKEKGNQEEDTQGKYLDQKYELVGTPSNATGQYAYPQVEVTYEYRIKTFEITTRVEPHMETTDEIRADGSTQEIEVSVRGGNILGEGATPYETVKYDENSTNPIEITPEENYQAKSIKINEREILQKDEDGINIQNEDSEYTISEDGKITLNTIQNIKENKEIVVEFEKIPAKVIVNHYIYDQKAQDPYTKQKVLTSKGEEAETIEIRGAIDDIYITKELNDVHAGYKLYKEPENSSGIMKKEPTYVNYYYSYNPSIEDSITKSGTQIIMSKDEEIVYTIQYTATIDYYEGDAEITIIDELPYKLDEQKMQEIANQKEIDTSEENWIEKMLDGGKYDSNAKTITWTQTMTGINSQEDEETRNILVNKEVTLVFADVEINQEPIRNKVKGKIKLIEEDKESEKEAIYETQKKFIKNVKVTKTWEHKNNNYEKPTGIIVKIKKANDIEGTPVSSFELNEENGWTHIFTDLQKYEANGDEIQYIVEEEAKQGEEEIFKYYKGNTTEKELE